MYAEQQTKSSNGLGIAAMVIGIIGFILVFIPIIGFVSWILSPLAVILGMVAIFTSGARISSVVGTATGLIGVLGCFWWLSLYNDVAEYAENKQLENRFEQAAAEAREDFAVDEYERGYTSDRSSYAYGGVEDEYVTDRGDEDVVVSRGTFTRKGNTRKQKDIFATAE